MAFQDILVPTDFRPGSRLAIERALDSLGPEGGRVTVLYVIDQQLLDHTLSLFPEAQKADLLARLQQQAHDQYGQLIAGVQAENVTFEPIIAEGMPFLKIVQLARDLDVDMIVMSMHRGAAHLEQVLFGSTAERVLRITPRPVLIVPATPSMCETASQDAYDKAAE